MKKLLLTSAIALFTLSAQAGDIKPVIGIDYVYSDIGLQNGWEYLAHDKYSSINLTAGAKVGKHFGAEAFFQHSNERDGLYTPYGSIKTSFYGFGADMIGYLPVHEKVNVLGSVGLGHYDVTAQFIGIEDSENGLGVRFGAGIQYDLTDNVALRSMARYVKLSGFESMDDMVEITTGLRFSF